MKSALLYLCSMSCMLSSLGADVDFSSQRLPVTVPPGDGGYWSSESMWGRVKLQNTPTLWVYEKFVDYLQGGKKKADDVLIGHVVCPKTLVAESTDHRRGQFVVKRLSVQYALEPMVNGMESIREKLKSFRVAFSIKAGEANNIQVTDIIPSTSFVDACISGKISITSRIGLARSGRFEMVDGGSSAGIDAGFSWVYQPKDLVVASSFVGNTAVVDFQPKKDGTFHVGQVPVEISLLVPADIQQAELSIITIVISDKDAIVPAGEAKVKVLLQ